MNKLHAILLGWVVALTLLFSGAATAQCTGNAFGYCADCTSPTPCCGYGPCNIFCGNCDGGCRKPPDGPHDPSCGSTSGNALDKALHSADATAPSTEDINALRARFDHIDTDHDGKLSLAETLAWAKTAKKDTPEGVVREGFGKADDNQSGQIEPAEFDKNLATPAKQAEAH